MTWWESQLTSCLPHPLFTPFGIHDEEMHSLDPYDGSDENGQHGGLSGKEWLRIPDEDGDVPEHAEDEDPPYRPNQRAWTVPEEAVFNAEPQSRGGRKGAREETHGDSA